MHRLRGRPSNRRLSADLRETVLVKYREHFGDFGPTLASEKLAELGLDVSIETLRQWLLAEELWELRRKRDTHRRMTFAAHLSNSRMNPFFPHRIIGRPPHADESKGR